MTRTCPSCGGDGYIDTGDILGGTVTCKDCMGTGEV